MSESESYFESALTDLGIDQSSLGEDPVELPEELSEEHGETVAPEEQGSEESDVDELNEKEAPIESSKPEEEIAPIEEQKLTLKEFQEIAKKEQELDLKQKAFQEEMSVKEKEFQAQYGEKVRVHDQMDEFFSHFAEKDPELFSILQSEFSEFNKQFTNPVVDKVSREVAELRKELGQFKAKASDEVVRTKLESEVVQVKNTIGKDAEAAGIKIDYAAVEDVWADNPKLSYEEAVWSKYGAQLAKAMASKAKVTAVEKKVQAIPKVVTAGTVAKSNVRPSVDVSKMSWDQATRYFAKQVMGKN